MLIIVLGWQCPVSLALVPTSRTTYTQISQRRALSSEIINSPISPLMNTFRLIIFFQDVRIWGLLYMF